MSTSQKRPRKVARGEGELVRCQAMRERRRRKASSESVARC